MIRNLSSRATLRLYMLGGVLFGLIFPVLAWAIDIRRDNAHWSWESVWLIHLANPVIWIVDTAPLVLGIFAYTLGKAKVADQLRRESAEQFRLLFENNPFPTWVYDADTLEFLVVNQAATNHYGYTSAEFLGIKATDIRPPELAPAFLERVRTRSEQGTNVPSVHRAKDGHDFEVEVSYHRIIFQGRQALLTVAANVTERKRAERALQEKEERLRHIIDHAVEIIYRADAQGNIVFANATALRIMQYTLNELIGRHYLDIIHPAHRRAAKRFHELQFVRKTPTTYYELKAVCKNGTEIWLGQNVQLLMENDQVIGLQAIARDITARKFAEDALREQEELLRRVVETVEDGIYIVDRDGKMSFANRAMEKILGAPREVLTNRAYNDAAWKITTVDGRPFPDEEHPSARVTQTKKPVSNVEQVIARADGTQVIVSINAAPILDAAGNVVSVVGSLADITERKAVERLKNEFVSTVSHELRTPLTSILGSLGLIMGGAAGEVSAPARAMIEIAHKNSERLVRLINDILDIEKIESGKMIFHLKPAHLMPIIEQTLEANRGYGERLGVAFEINARADDLKVNADSDRLIQVLTNLLSNAAKYSPQGERVRISVTRRDHSVRVAVSDKGPGIPDEFRMHIFQKFQQADSSDTRQKGGTGLGLSIAKAIVEKHGGQIGFETELGAGTTFYFDLPIWQDAGDAPFSSTTVAGMSTPRILICEDDRDIANLIMLMLAQAGFGADVAYDTEQARGLLAQSTYAALTLDIALPNQNGLAFFRELRNQDATRNLPVIFVSLEAQEGQAELNGDAVLVLDWIEKPIDQKRLIAAVRAATGAKAGRTPRVLHIEDDADVRQVVAGILGGVAQVSSANSLQQAKQKLAGDYDLVILDLSLGDGSGAELIPLLHQQHPTLPVVIFSAHEVSAELAERVSAALVKSRTTNEEFVKTIQRLVQN